MTYRPLAPEEIAERVSQLLERSQLATDFQDALKYALSDGLDPRQVRERLLKARIPLNALYADLFEELWEHYASYKAENAYIDYDDMIRGTLQKIKDGEITSEWDYILIDEFQDISRPRFDLVLALKEARPGSVLYMVGDDWQSIYGFSGARVEYISRLQDFVGPYSEAKIETTFRYTRSIAETAGAFVMKNPTQKRKSIRSIHQTEPSNVCLCSFDYEGHELTRIVNMIDRLRHQEKNASFGLLFRTKRSLNKIAPEIMARLVHVPDFDPDSLSFLTAHSSKGLEFDFVFLFDLSEGVFPSSQIDSPILHCLKPKTERFAHAEERRLFYVALTRGRKGVFLMASAERPSTFVAELLKDETYDFLPMAPPFATRNRPSSAVCPECDETLVWRLGPYGFFKKCGACADRHKDGTK